MLFIRRIVLLSLAASVSMLYYFRIRLFLYKPSMIENESHGPSSQPLFSSDFRSGIPKPPGHRYTETLVMGRLESEDVSWVSQELPGMNTSIYIVDSNTTSLPANKGHEAMVYLTYIIEHYHNLPDIVFFFHAHRSAWHNSIMMNIDSSVHLKWMSRNHIIRQGYFNTRCHQDPGCPNWIHVDRSSWLWDWKHKPEEPFFTNKLFHQLHGQNVPIPPAISQPCCAQFAVSGQRIRSRPLETYIHYRDWLLNTPFHDDTSGRIMEYSWQYIFTGLFEYCPAAHVCYCDGYGICFGSNKNLNAWLRVLHKKSRLDEKLLDMWNRKKTAHPEYGRLMDKSNAIQKELEKGRDWAMERGADARLRAEECGRVWRQGEGY